MTNKEIEQALPGDVIRDRGHPQSVTGLHLRAFTTKKVFYVYYTSKGIQRRPKIGVYGVFTIDQARRVARQMIAEATVGIDPSVIKRTLRAEKTIHELFAVAWESHWGKDKYRESGHSREVKRLYTKHLAPHFGHLKLSELTVAMVGAWLETFTDNIYAGNRSLEVLSTMYRFAEKKEWRAQNTNPCKLVDAFTEKKRERYATPLEIKRIGEILERESANRPVPVAFIKTLIFTGSRPSAIERARWCDLEVRQDGTGVLTVCGKSGAEKLHLSVQAMKVIHALPRKGEKIFNIRMPREFWDEVRAEAGCTDLWARDWRRTFASILMSGGEAMPVISELLNHKSVQTTKIYAKLDDEKRMELAGVAGQKLENLLGGGV